MSVLVFVTCGASLFPIHNYSISMRQLQNSKKGVTPAKHVLDLIGEITGGY